MKKQEILYQSWEEVRWEASITDADLSNPDQKAIYDEINEKIEQGESMLDGTHEEFDQEIVLSLKSEVLMLISELSTIKKGKAA
jgi:hypothetical protein